MTRIEISKNKRICYCRCAYIKKANCMIDNILNFNKKKNEKKLKKMYSDGYWYKNTYNALGSMWLTKALELLDLPEGYRLGNFSANVGWYEKDAFDASTKYPTYYISDINMEEIEKDIRPHNDNYKVISGNKDAKDITLSMIDNKPLDLIIDCKGALWYSLSLKHGGYKKLIKLLDTYYNLLNENGVLLIDWYDNKKWRLQNIIYHGIYHGNKKRTNLKYFGEASTKYYYEQLIKEDANIDIWPMNLEKTDNPEWPLLKYMDVAVISKKEVLKLINYIKANKIRIEKEYKTAPLKHDIKLVMIGVFLGIILSVFIYGR